MLLVVLALLLAACSQNSPAEPTKRVAPTETSQPTQIAVVATATPSSMPTSTLAPTVAPSKTPTSKPTSTRTRTPTRKPTVVPTNTPAPPPTRLSGPAGVCADLIAQGRIGLHILYIEPNPELVWDYDPRMFRVGICNSIPPPAVPQGRYRIFIYFPGSQRGRAQSGSVPATLNPGVNEVNVGPWIPGLENHRAACNDRPIGEVEVEYDGSGHFEVLSWADGKKRFGIPIKCGGDYA